MKQGCFILSILFLGFFAIQMCSRSEEAVAPDVAEIESASDVVPAQSGAVRADPATVETCEKAKAAAVAARIVYDRDYERRNPGAKSAALTVGELDSCRLTVSGAFVGKWGGQRWRYIPKLGKTFSENPREVWISDEPPAGEPRMWFSEWRSIDASAAKTRQLDTALGTAEFVQ